MPAPLVSLIAAVAQDGGIGHRGELLAKLPRDLARFKRLTLGAPVVMGRKTWDSIGWPLPERRNIVLTRDPHWHADGAEAVPSFAAAMALADGVERVFAIGGAAIFAFALPLADTLELTEIDAAFPADAYFPAWDRGAFRQTAREPLERADGLRYSFVTYRRKTPGDRDV